MATKHSDIAQDKPMVAGMVHKHEKKLHPGKPQTQFAKGGKTKVRGTGAATKGVYARGPMA